MRDNYKAVINLAGNDVEIIYKRMPFGEYEDQKNKLPEKCHSALNQGAEEIFCMVYASTYSKHPPVTYLNKNCQDFI